MKKSNDLNKANVPTDVPAVPKNEAEKIALEKAQAEKLENKKIADKKLEVKKLEDDKLQNKLDDSKLGNKLEDKDVEKKITDMLDKEIDQCWLSLRTADLSLTTLKKILDNLKVAMEYKELYLKYLNDGRKD